MNTIPINYKNDLLSPQIIDYPMSPPKVSGIP